MSDPRFPTNDNDDEMPSLAALDARLKKAKAREEAKSAPSEGGNSHAGDAMRIGIELVAGIVVGVGAGVLLDKWLGTSPWFFLTCFCLGVAGSGLNIYRLAKRGDSGKSTGENEQD